MRTRPATIAAVELPPVNGSAAFVPATVVDVLPSEATESEIRVVVVVPPGAVVVSPEPAVVTVETVEVVTSVLEVVSGATEVVVVVDSPGGGGATVVGLDVLELTTMVDVVVERGQEVVVVDGLLGMLQPSSNTAMPVEVQFFPA
jgi:hypothetical protein